MKLKSLILNLCIFSLLIPCYAQIPTPTSNTSPEITAQTTTISRRKDNIVWKYKTVNGVLYKRQYNKTTHEWIGKWVKA